MKNSFAETMRDILLFGALILLIREVFERAKGFVSEHKESIIHELDQNFIDYLYTTQRHAHILAQQELSEKDAQDISNLKNSLALIEEKYKKNSPALAFLGPIGATAIVSKEAELEEKLLKAANAIGKLFNELTKAEEQFTPAATLFGAIEHNKTIAKQLTA